MELRKDYITALADKENIDPGQLLLIEKEIKENPGLRQDYHVQLLMKQAVTGKNKFRPVPDAVKKKIVKKVSPGEGINFLPGILSRPLVAYGTAAIIIIAVILIIFNLAPQFEDYDFAAEQSGENNMLIQAENNFKALAEGREFPEIISKNPEDIKIFFKQQGVEYSAIIPIYERWNLSGGFVTEENNTKFANLIYGGSGMIIYILQADENIMGNNGAVNLSKDLLKYLDEGNCYTSLRNGNTALITKSSGNIFVVVSGLSLEEVKKSFCNFN